MTHRIKTIWILSLVSIILLIGMQIYWLVNQYEFVLNAYSEEMATQVIQASEEEFLERKDERPLFITYMIQVNPDTAAYKHRVLLNVAMSPQPMSADATPSPTEQRTQMRTVRQQTRMENDIPQLSPDSAMDTTRLTVSFSTNLTGDELHKATEKSIMNMLKPFNEARFVEILNEKFSEMDYTVASWHANDTYENIPLWRKTGRFFNPYLIVSYAYSPLENQGLYIHIQLPAQPILTRMAIQLFVSIGLTLLLIVCFILQMRTIVKQRKVNEIRENFVNTMVHELKRPVQTLKTFVSFLKDKNMRVDEKMTEEVSRDAMFELDNLSAYLHKLKDMLHADSETTSLHKAKFNLHHLVEKVIRLTHTPPNKEVVIVPVYDTADDIYMEADPIHVANILSNLIENAIKYSGEKVHIEVHVGQEKRNVRISVKDNGIGIPLAEQDRIFTKFYRANNIPDKSIPGIGLGLSYVKLMTEAHHGNVHIDSDAGKGTTITIYLPK